MDVDDYLRVHPVPVRPSDKRLRAYLQAYIQVATPRGKRFTQGAAIALSTLAADRIMRAPSIAARRGATVAALRSLDAVAERLEDADPDTVSGSGDHERVDAFTIKALDRAGGLAGVPVFGEAVRPAPFATARRPVQANDVATAPVGGGPDADPDADADDAAERETEVTPPATVTRRAVERTCDNARRGRLRCRARRRRSGRLA